jgi:hypothetical protein
MIPPVVSSIFSKYLSIFSIFPFRNREHSIHVDHDLKDSIYGGEARLYVALSQPEYNSASAGWPTLNTFGAYKWENMFSPVRYGGKPLPWVAVFVSCGGLSVGSDKSYYYYY